MQVYNIILGEVSFIIATLYKVVHNVCALKCASVHALDSMLMMVGHHTLHSFVWGEGPKKCGSAKNMPYKIV